LDQLQRGRILERTLPNALAPRATERNADEHRFPIKGADSSDNNALDVKDLAREGYKVLIQRRTGGIDIVNGKRVPYVDKRFELTNRAIKDTDMIPGDYAFPINPDFLDIDVQVNRFLHSGPPISMDASSP
jgi:hypothetical protein